MDKLTFQNEIKTRLDISYKQNKLFHSYIFSGAKNSGRLDMAKYLAKLVIEKDGHLIDDLMHPNVFYVTTEKQNISKDQVLKINEEINTTSLTGNNKVFIIEDAHKLSISAQNSLLKVIEEPQGNSYIIFIVENVHQLLTTIVSRSQIVKFKPVPFELLYSDICEDYEDKLKLKYALYIDNANYQELYEDEEFGNYLEMVYNYLEGYFVKPDKILYLLEEICYSKCKNKEKMLMFLNFLIINVSSLINYKNSVDPKLFDERLEGFSEQLNVKQLTQFLNNIFECYEMVNTNVNIKLAFDKLTERM